MLSSLHECPKKPQEASIIPSLQIKKLRLGEVKQFVTQLVKGRNRNLNPGLADSRTLSTLLHWFSSFSEFVICYKMCENLPVASCNLFLSRVSEHHFLWWRKWKPCIGHLLANYSCFKHSLKNLFGALSIFLRCGSFGTTVTFILADSCLKL